MMPTMTLTDSLNTYFQFNQFREGQLEVIEQVLSGHSSLAIFPTGSGKSLCYQLSALHLPHLTLVVSPLLALMKDQVDFLKQKGIAAASLDSSLTKEAYFDVVTKVKAGEIKILMVSVERFKNERFRQFINQVPISMMVIDEAHCISEWGHNFRPDYLKLPVYREQLGIPTVLLLTATATKKVKQDMAAKFAIEPELIIQTGFYRHNLNLMAESVEKRGKSTQLVNFIHQQSGAGIVYVTLQNTAQEVATLLSQQGINAKAYHAGLGNEIRQQIQHQFMQGDVDVIVATIAFGMGIDKNNIRFVVHYDLPKSIENYSQEIGRAGRDGQPANCLVLGHLDELTTLENFIYGDTPEPESIAQLIEDITHSSQDEQWHCQLYQLSQSCNIRQLTLKTLLVQCELMGLIEAKFSYFANYRYCFTGTQESALAEFQGERREFLAFIFDNTEFKKKWGTIDLDHVAQQSGYGRERIIAALEYLQQQQLIELETKQLIDVYQVNIAALSNSDVIHQLHHYFAAKEQSEIARIHTMLRYFQLDTCYSYNLARYFDDHHAPQQCGHCSVCQGKIAKFDYINKLGGLDLEELKNDISILSEHFEQHNKTKMLTPTLVTRYFTGLSQPVFTQLKASKLAGFARLQKQPYQQVFDAVRSAL